MKKHAAPSPPPSSAIIPTVFSHSKQEFTARLNKIQGLTRNIQIDFMDGTFVKDKSIALRDVPNLEANPATFEAHLMTSSPRRWLAPLRKKGFSKVIFHIEATRNAEETLAIIHEACSLNLHPFIAINPSTPIERVFPFINHAAGILIMGIPPGKEHQRFLTKNYQRIRRLREKSARTPIQVDGGVLPSVAEKLARVGTDLINSGSYIATAKQPAKALEKLQDAFTKGAASRTKAKEQSQTYDRITKHIYLGPNRCCLVPGFDKELVAQGISADVSLEEFRIDAPHGIKHFLWLPTPDHKPPTLDQLFTGTAFLHAIEKRNAKAYVHCELGRTRSPTLVAAYLISKGKTIAQAIDFIKKKRPYIHITKAQRAGLARFASTWRNHARR
ncbi:hypothetical protein D6783_04435 [Candidatus Woesearchaeota archaeon]|nr:MAG: hypothetical protein D6783_04435 [Candidatus Woesearchaeota archaeon]